MSGHAEMAPRLLNALEAVASEAAGKPTELASVAIEVLQQQGLGNVSSSITRKTRTLIFAAAELHGETGERIALATSVHKIPA